LSGATSLSSNPAASALNEALIAAASRILTIKAGELSELIHKYVCHGENVPARPRRLAVDNNGNRIELDVEHIRWVQASGNYVRLYTSEGAFEMRETIQKLHATLEPAGFIRIHRGALVNASAIAGRVVQNDTLVAVLLSDETRVPVGPTYRNEVPDDRPVVPNRI